MKPGDERAAGDQADEAARLEAALSRIEAGVRRDPAPGGLAAAGAIGTAAIAERLDSLIAALRTLLGGEG